MNIAIILAGGIGSRMGMKDTPKQFIEIYGKPILVHTLEKFDNNINIDKIYVVALKSYIDEVRALIRKFDISKVELIVEGGKTRQESIRNALDEIEKVSSDEDIVIIHDSVRPLISSRIIDENILYANKYGAVDTVIPTSDTIIKSIDGINIDSVPLRKELYLGQTPQSFKFNIINEAHKYAETNKVFDATDDCQLISNMGKDVYLVNGEKLNFKVTTFEDLTILKSIIKIGSK